MLIVIVIVFFWSEREDERTDEWIENWGHSSIMLFSSFENEFEMGDVKEQQQQKQQQKAKESTRVCWSANEF